MFVYNNWGCRKVYHPCLILQYTRITEVHYFDFLGAGTGGCSTGISGAAGLSSIGGAEASLSSTVAELLSISCSPNCNVFMLSGYFHKVYVEYLEVLLIYI